MMGIDNEKQETKNKNRENCINMTEEYAVKSNIGKETFLGNEAFDMKIGLNSNV